MNDYSALLNDFISKFSEGFLVKSDEDLEKKLRTQLGRRGALYSDFLENYSKITRARHVLKEFHKWAFFWLVMLSGGVIIHFICRMMNRVLSIKDTEEFIKSIPIIITAFSSLLSAIIVVPITITKFLFNAKEDDNITSTIHHTQDHDNDEATFLIKKDMNIDNTSSTQNTPSHVNIYLGKEDKEYESIM